MVEKQNVELKLIHMTNKNNCTIMLFCYYSKML